MTGLALSENDVCEFRDDFVRINDTLAQAIVGQEDLIDLLTTGVIAGGHILLEGMPGLGKTQLAKSLAQALGTDLSRIQCTPDLMPTDITGSEVFLDDPGNPGARALGFRPGPLFSPMVLVDEINRATPKTQSAFLEAMQEGQVSYAGQCHSLPSPFWVIATQNPVEIEGTYPLPEAQIDRFLFMLKVKYPDAEALERLTAGALDREPATRVEACIDQSRLKTMMAQSHEVVIAQPLVRQTIDLILNTQPAQDDARAPMRTHIRYGASPRGLQAVLKAARVAALAAGRGHVSLGDIIKVAIPSLRHRILLTMESEMEGMDTDTLLADIIERWSARLT